MNNKPSVRSCAAILCALCAQAAWSAAPESDAVTRKNAHDIFKQLIEINTTDSIGSTTVAAQAMAQRLVDAGFPRADVVVLGPNDRKGRSSVQMIGPTAGTSASRSTLTTRALNSIISS